MKLTSPRKSRRHDPLSLYSRPATSLQLDSRPITEIWEELGVYQKAVSSTPDTAQMFMGAPTYTHIGKVFDLIKWDLSQNEPTHTSTWNIVKHWDTGPLDAEQTIEFQKTLIRIITTWRKVEENPNIAPCMGFVWKARLSSL
ncbi:hypothetical protein CVT25_015202 [Psilocybe cyanescens]|uniref:Uncharacterized protein n=1 Tax=Psilocybe cyanescens TaxID=93625 RepID=A0A409WRK2_PSICY|nr:hypothetical protein CVT25_015202 [Psilocybe cyanescens]